MGAELRRRRGGPTWQMFGDLLADAWWTRSWLLLVVLVLTIIAAAVAVAGQVVVPWAVYPAL